MTAGSTLLTECVDRNISSQQKMIKRSPWSSENLRLKEKGKGSLLALAWSKDHVESKGVKLEPLWVKEEESSAWQAQFLHAKRRSKCKWIKIKLEQTWPCSQIWSGMLWECFPSLIIANATELYQKHLGHLISKLFGNSQMSLWCTSALLLVWYPSQLPVVVSYDTGFKATHSRHVSQMCYCIDLFFFKHDLSLTR